VIVFTNLFHASQFQEEKRNDILDVYQTSWNGSELMRFKQKRFKVIFILNQQYFSDSALEMNSIRSILSFSNIFIFHPQLTADFFSILLLVILSIIAVDLKLPFIEDPKLCFFNFCIIIVYSFTVTTQRAKISYR